MKLNRFRVRNFRSVEDSGWIDVSNVTALIGVNESGKTNLLVPLWKLNPAREGEIHATSDYPKRKFGEIRDAPGEFCFIEAEFETEEIAATIGELAKLPVSNVKRVIVKRYYDGEYTVAFPDYEPGDEVSAGTVLKLLGELRADIDSLAALKQEEGIKQVILDKVRLICETLEPTKKLKANKVAEIWHSLKGAVPEVRAKTSTIVPRLEQTLDALNEMYQRMKQPLPDEKDEVISAVLKSIPKFVYYSNYGNLDSEIYLPHVVQNLERKDLGAKEAAKARTLRVLFKFVRLKPSEILELGRDFKDPHNPNREPTTEEIAAIAEKKRERSILLQSAGTTLTAKFKEWWRQGDYRFRFDADGNHFRIWVSDDRRPDEVELESRSTGLQWFLSFYLVFLVESLGEHKDAILLLDEPGLSLHPLAQRNLSSFFDGLTRTNQILYTTHSPFLVDADRLERARKVYVAEDGTTRVTADLRYGDSDPKQAGAAYAVHSALNLSVAESLLLGCQPVIVEGPSDQHYLTAIKSLLIGAEKIAPRRELVFPPSGGAKTAKVVASILTGKDEELPRLLLDSDEQGRRMAQELRSTLYQSAPHRIITIGSFVGFGDSETEDLFDPRFLAEVIDRWERRPERPFSDIVVEGEPIVGQIERWAKKYELTLPLGWKVELAKRVKQLALARGLSHFRTANVERWIALFNAFSSENE